MLPVPVSPIEDKKADRPAVAQDKERKKMRTKSLAGVLIALLLIAGATAASAQEVTQAEKDKALQYLETTKKNVLEATKGLSEAQWNFKPAPDRWSVAQVMEHIAAAEDFLRTLASFCRKTSEFVKIQPDRHGFKGFSAVQGAQIV